MERLIDLDRKRLGCNAGVWQSLAKEPYGVFYDIQKDLHRRFAYNLEAIIKIKNIIS
jgi:hypothetical protein